MGLEEEPKEEYTKEETGEEYSFISESIKQKPLDHRDILKKIAILAGAGLIVGIAACVGFYAMKPWAEQKFQKNPEKVEIPKDDDETEEVPEEDSAQEPTTPVLTLDNVKELQNALTAVAQDSGKSMVEVIGVREDVDWTEETYDTVNSVSGVVFANNSREYLILASSSILKEASQIQVKFVDGALYDASLKAKDGNLGFAVFSVPISSLSDTTRNQVTVCTLGNSNVTKRGETVIALGKQFSYSGGLGIGIISSTRNKIALADGEYRLLCTDIAGTEHGTGFLFNLSGELIGIIKQDVTQGESMQLTNAIAVSGVKEEMETLARGEAVPYIGINGIEVTQTLSESMGIPEGIYVKNVEVDSPAMAAGIQSGDVIVSVAGTTTKTMQIFHNTLLDTKTGDSIKITGQRKGNNGYVDISFHATVGSK